MKIPKGSIDNEPGVPDTPNASEKSTSRSRKPTLEQTESVAQSQGRIWSLKYGKRLYLY